MNTLQEKDKIINYNSPLYEEFSIDEVPEDLIFDEYSPCTSAPADYCDNSYPNPIIIDAYTISDNKDIQTEIKCQGRLLTIRVILKYICPNRKIAIGVILFEGNKVRGFQVKEIVAPPLPTNHPSGSCDHVVVCKFYFVLSGSIASPLTLTPKVIAHYTDFNI